MLRTATFAGLFAALLLLVTPLDVKALNDKFPCGKTAILKEKGGGSRILTWGVKSDCDRELGLFGSDIGFNPFATDVPFEGFADGSFNSNPMNFLLNTGATASVTGTFDPNSGNIVFTIVVSAPMETIIFESQFPNQNRDLGVVTVAGLQQGVGQHTQTVGDAIGAGFSSHHAEAGVTPIAGGYRLQAQSAGDGFDYPWGLWGSYQYSDFEDEFATTAFDANRHAVMVGADFSPWEAWVFGAMLGYESVDNDTIFNGGNIDTDGLTIAPYMGVLLSDSVGVDFDLSAVFVLGYSHLDHDQFRTIGTTRITSDTDSHRYFLSGNLIAGRSYGNWYVSGQAGLLVAREDIDGFTESNGNVVGDDRVQLGQASIGGDVAYAWGSFEPFASAIFSHDYSREELGGGHPNDQNELRLGFGIRYFSEQGFTARS